MGFLYFAYGSNMLPRRLLGRCPSAQFIATASVVGFDLAFSKVSNDGSGKATLLRLDNAETPGALFEMETADLRALDAAEGVGFGYDRNDCFEVQIESGQYVSAKTYVASALDENLKPYDWYLALVIAGARHHSFSDDYLARLQTVEYVIDAYSDRKTRCEAVAALQGEGFDDYRSLLHKA